jgi:hypothetical protein
MRSGDGLEDLERPRLAVVALALGDHRAHAIAGHAPETNST